MSLPGSQQDREYGKFRDGEDGKPAIAIMPAGDSLNVETAGIKWDEIITTFPAANIDVFTYKLATVTVQTVTVTYESAAKKTPVSVLKVRL
jgi:hypothetical protein